MSLQEKLDQMKKDFESSAPAEVVAVMHKETQVLIESGITGNVLKKGEMFPEFSLKDQKGEMVSSRDLIEKGPLVVSFYRGVW